ncbi:MAG TPA: nuclear transport factor 2 family protein [Thermoanaerobaculia bacterium]|nr:nuclear transport factor 2 family protein [Thermoanaerobaculia bacterium]
MNTRETVQKYLDSIHNGFQSLLTDDVKFTSFTSPVRSVAGKAAYIAATNKFYSKVASFEVRDLIVDANRACALTRYEIRGKDGGTFTSDVAEVFTVQNGKIDSLAIYFDLTPYPR